MSKNHFITNRDNLSLSCEDVYNSLTNPVVLSTIYGQNPQNPDSPDSPEWISITLDPSERDWDNYQSERLVLGITPSGSDALFTNLSCNPHIILLFRNKSNTLWIFVVKAFNEQEPINRNRPCKGFTSYSEAHSALSHYIHARYGLTMLKEEKTLSRYIELHHAPDTFYRKHVIHLKQQPLPMQHSSALPHTPKNLTIAQKLDEIERATQRSLVSELIRPTPLLIRVSGGTVENVLYPNTVNIIQGKTGTHKSRFAGLLASTLIHPEKMEVELGFKLNPAFSHPVRVVYIDTERNTTNQNPEAMKDILKRIGKVGNKEQLSGSNFHPYPLVGLSRAERLSALKIIVTQLRQNYTDHLVVVIDVATDMTSDFNNLTESQEFIDFQNTLINEHNTTFLNVIHENPYGDKPRGHLGTELMNKASVIFQLNHKGKVGKDPIYEVRCRKQRDDVPFSPFAFKYAGPDAGFQLAHGEGKQLENQKGRASIEETGSLLSELLTEKKPRPEVLLTITSKLSCSERTLEGTLKQFVADKLSIVNQSGDVCHLHKIGGRPVWYELRIVA